MNHKRSGSSSSRRVLAILGGCALVLGIVLVVAGVVSAHRSVFWGGVCALLTGLVWLVCARYTRNEPMRPAQRRYLREFFPAMAGYVVLLFVSQALHVQGRGSEPVRLSITGTVPAGQSVAAGNYADDKVIRVVY
ncbi:hypothetical protein [Rhodanobacter lindaniclasticus]